VNCFFNFRLSFKQLI